MQLQEDKKKPEVSVALMECLSDEPKGLVFFQSLPGSHRLYFSRWIESARTEATKTKRIAQAVTALSKGFGYGEMMRSLKQQKNGS